MIDRCFKKEICCGYDTKGKTIWKTFEVTWPRELLYLEFDRDNNPAYHGDKYSYYKIRVITNTNQQRVRDIINEWARFNCIKASDDPYKYMYTQIDDSKLRFIKTTVEYDEYEFCVYSPYVD